MIHGNMNLATRSNLDRNVDFYSVWLPSVLKARKAMLQDPLMLAVDRMPMPQS